MEPLFKSTPSIKRGAQFTCDFLSCCPAWRLVMKPCLKTAILYQLSKVKQDPWNPLVSSEPIWTHLKYILEKLWSLSLMYLVSRQMFTGCWLLISLYLGIFLLFCHTLGHAKLRDSFLVVFLVLQTNFERERSQHFRVHIQQLVIREQLQ